MRFIQRAYEMRDTIQTEYALDDAIVDRIEFQFKTKVGNRGNNKVVRICEGYSKLEGVIRIHDDPAMLSRALTLRDLEMKVRYCDGYTIDTD